jgi:hypothetical protein
MEYRLTATGECKGIQANSRQVCAMEYRLAATGECNGIQVDSNW